MNIIVNAVVFGVTGEYESKRSGNQIKKFLVDVLSKEVGGKPDTSFVPAREELHLSPGDASKIDAAMSVSGSYPEIKIIYEQSGIASMRMSAISVTGKRFALKQV